MNGRLVAGSDAGYKLAANCLEGPAFELSVLVCRGHDKSGKWSTML